jgi:hypothetical protein
MGDAIRASAIALALATTFLVITEIILAAIVWKLAIPKNRKAKSLVLLNSQSQAFSNSKSGKLD